MPPDDPPSGERAASVRGMGVVTPVGSTIDDFWAAVLAGAGTAAEELSFDEGPEGLEALGCPARGFDPASRLERRELRRLDRAHLLAYWAAEDALAAAGPGPEPERCAIVVGTGIGPFGFLERQAGVMRDRGLRAVSPAVIPVGMPNSVAAHLSIRFDYRGPATTINTACASGAMAIGEALWLLRTGRADRVLAGGVEAMDAAALVTGFVRLEAMSTRFAEPHRASRPFDVDRDGFVLGEGAGFVVLERAGDSSAPDHGRVLGYGTSSDAEGIVAPAADGRGAIAAMREAIDDAGVEPTAIGHVNAHGTSTRLNDAIEGAAIRAVFGDHRLPVTATKSVIGHLIGAAGAVETIAALLSCRRGVVPPVANLDRFDDTIDVDVRGTAVEPTSPLALSNSFAFGGHNASLVVG